MFIKLKTPKHAEISSFEAVKNFDKEKFILASLYKIGSSTETKHFLLTRKEVLNALEDLNYNNKIFDLKGFIQGRAILKNINQTGSFNTPQRRISYLEFIEPIEGKFFKYYLPINYLGQKDVKFGIFHKKVSRLVIETNTLSKVYGNIEIWLNNFFTITNRKLNYEELRKAIVDLNIVGLDKDLICQYRLTSQERKDLHQKWMAKTQGNSQTQTIQ